MTWIAICPRDEVLYNQHSLLRGDKIDGELESYYYSLDQKDRSLGQNDVNYAVDMWLSFTSNT